MDRRCLPRWNVRCRAPSSAEQLHVWPAAGCGGHGGLWHGAGQVRRARRGALQHAQELRELCAGDWAGRTRWQASPVPPLLAPRGEACPALLARTLGGLEDLPCHAKSRAFMSCPSKSAQRSQKFHGQNKVVLLGFFTWGKLWKGAGMQSMGGRRTTTL